METIVVSSDILAKYKMSYLIPTMLKEGYAGSVANYINTEV